MTMTSPVASRMVDVGEFTATWGVPSALSVNEVPNSLP